LVDADLTGDGSPYVEKLNQIYLEGFPLSHLRDTADLIVRAEGPAAAEAAPQTPALPA